MFVAIYTNRPTKIQRKTRHRMTREENNRIEKKKRRKKRIYEISEIWKIVTNVWYGDKRNMEKHAEEAM